MALVFLATQSLSHRSRNESPGDYGNRPRLSGKKRPRKLFKQDCVDENLPEDPWNRSNPLASDYPISSLQNYPVGDTQGPFTEREQLPPVCPTDGGAEEPVWNNFLDENDDFLTSEDDEEEEDLAGREDDSSNNNNDFTFDLNKSDLHKSESTESFPSIQWPLDNSSKSRRIANIRKQVKELSSAIKMAIDSENVQNGCHNPNPAPFSSLVEMSIVQNICSTPMAATTNLPSIGELHPLLSSSKINEAKLLIRRSFWGSDHLIRKELWGRLIQHISKDEFQDAYYWDAVQQIYGSKDVSECNVMLPPFVDKKHIVDYGLSLDGVKACERIISVIAYNYPAITFAPLVYPLTAIFCHYMEEPEAYNCISVLLSKSNNFINQTKIKHESMWRTANNLAQKHVKSGFGVLRKMGVSAEQISQGFQQWTQWIFSYLPFSHVIRVVDCFLLEGFKVLLRVSLALFEIFVKASVRDSEILSSISTRGFAEAISTYCESIQESPTKLLKSAFGIRGFGKEQIKKVLIHSESLVKSEPPTASYSSSASNRLMRCTSIEEQPTNESQAIIQSASHTLDVRELLMIWGWLPMRMTMYHPSLIYTTEEHGSLLSNFFQRVDCYEPTILIVRTITDEVFGAYCSASWKQRNERDEYGHKQTYFGTGETFLFTLRPRLRKYEWVGISQQRLDSALSSVAHQSELFMHADNDMITVGGGRGHGLMLDHDLRYGKTETCETFDNDPLSSTPDFEIKVVEVYSLGERD